MQEGTRQGARPHPPAAARRLGPPVRVAHLAAARHGEVAALLECESILFCSIPFFARHAVGSAAGLLSQLRRLWFMSERICLVRAAAGRIGTELGGRAALAADAWAAVAARQQQCAALVAGQSVARRPAWHVAAALQSNIRSTMKSGSCIGTAWGPRREVHGC